MAFITSKLIQKDHYEKREFFNFSQSVQKNRPQDEFSFGRSVQIDKDSSITTEVTSFFEPKDFFEELSRISYKLSRISPMRSLNNDIIGEISKQCLSNSVKDALSLARTNKRFYNDIRSFLSKLDLRCSCPSNLTIMDAKKLEFLGLTIDDEPSVDALAVRKLFHKVAPYIENEKGLTLLTMNKGLTLNKLVAIAKEAGIRVVFQPRKILKKIGAVPVARTYRVMITNSVFRNSRTISYYVLEKPLLEIEYEKPTVQEYVALCIFQKILNNKSLYERNPSTSGRSSTSVDYSYLVVGNLCKDRLSIEAIALGNGNTNVGEGGRWKV